ncbi:efflux RND transporter periplasmic adaptor subunit [Aliidiomarina halalkaliphila]|uniref:Efflux RND transporter periplasmic adaptor subunit n=1 Tax=Aliidiomarina halalkaliphila TaxID=2593535 RepID=A0A552WZ71_9GAMM|nr:efflux RND transporter periplasmic adaptor subunit [Aliidiomarina halalkaliphila]TRW48121.1 efflux RND transporter periplasmic adaptor subunit [Aliidiomarina halalkaliphila]
MVRAWYLIAGFCLLLAGCSDAPSDSSNDQPGGERHTPIAAYEVTPRDLSRQLTLSATVEPRIQVNLTSRTQGVVSSIAIEESDFVEAGQTLAQFDVAEQRAELRRAEARAYEAKLEFERLQQLRESNTISIAELQRAEATYAAAAAERDLWQTRIDFGAILAPLSGIVTGRYIEVGESIEAQQALFSLANMDELVVRPGVSERDIRHLSVGDDVPVLLDGLPDQEFRGTIRRIFPIADRSSRLLRIEVLLPEEAYEQGVRPGFLGRLPLTVDPRPNALAVPAAAIGEDAEQRYIYRVVNERLERTYIEVGITRGQWTEVLSGIDEGDVVLATNPIDMRDGTAVRIVNWRG